MVRGRDAVIVFDGMSLRSEMRIWNETEAELDVWCGHLPFVLQWFLGMKCFTERVASISRSANGIPAK